MLHIKQDHSEFVVLSVLAAGPSYGYAISKEIAVRSEEAFKLSASALYPLLTKLEKQGLVVTTWEEIKASGSSPESSGRKRKWYTMSPKGFSRLSKHIENLNRVREILAGFVPASFDETQIRKKGAT